MAPLRARFRARRAAAPGRLPPVDMTPLILVAFPALLWLDEGSAGPWASARLGYVFALGFFVAGLYWMAAALFVDIERFWWALPFAGAGLAGAARLLPGRGARRNGMRRPPGCAWRRWRGSACSRSSGAPPNGCAATSSPASRGTSSAMSGRAAFPGSLAMLQTTAWIGIYGLSFVTVLAASLPALLGTPLLRADAAGAAGRSGDRRGAADAGADGRRRGAARRCCRPARPRPGCAWCSPRSRRA